MPRRAATWASKRGVNWLTARSPHDADFPRPLLARQAARHAPRAGRAPPRARHRVVREPCPDAARRVRRGPPPVAPRHCLQLGARDDEFTRLPRATIRPGRRPSAAPRERPKWRSRIDGLEVESRTKRIGATDTSHRSSRRGISVCGAARLLLESRWTRRTGRRRATTSECRSYSASRPVGGPRTHAAKCRERQLRRPPARPCPTAPPRQEQPVAPYELPSVVERWTFRECPPASET